MLGDLTTSLPGNPETHSTKLHCNSWRDGSASKHLLHQHESLSLNPQNLKVLSHHEEAISLPSAEEVLLP